MSTRRLFVAALLLAVVTRAPAQCDRPASCVTVTQPPGSCTTSLGCPAGYACVAGECRAGACVVRADCAAGGQCVHQGSAADGVCVCRGCAEWDCSLGCSLGGVFTGCRCSRLDDCPAEDSGVPPVASPCPFRRVCDAPCR